MNKRELWEKVKLAIDKAKRFADEHHAAKVIAGGGIGALVGKKVTGDNRGVTSGAIIGALAALAHNNRINAKRIEGGQDYLAQGQQMQTRALSYNDPQGAIEIFRDIARSKYASALEKIAGYNGWAGSNRASNDEASDVVAAHSQALRSQQKALQDKADQQKTIGISGMGLGAAAGGYAAKGLVGLARPPVWGGRMRIAGKAGLAGLVGAGLLYGGKKLYDKHHATSAEAAQSGEKAKAFENWVNYFNGIKGKLR